MWWDRSHEALLDSVASRRGLLAEVDALEKRVEDLGADAGTSDLLAAVESLRKVRARYERPRSAPSRGPTTPEPFENLEADVARRRERLRSADAARSAEEARETAEREKASEKARRREGRPFESVERHQAEQEKRAAIARQKRLEEQEAEHVQFKAKPIRCALGARRSPGKKEEEEEEEGPPASRPDPKEVVRRLDDAHDRWCRALEKAKVSGRAGTVPVPFFESRRAALERRAEERRAQRRARAEEAAAREREAERAAARRHRAACAKKLAPEVARQTYSTYLRAQAVREKERALRDDKEAEAAAARDREQRLRDAAVRVNKELRRKDLERQRRADDLREEAARNQKEFRRNLKNNKRRYQQVASKAPSLIARLNIATAKEKARVNALRRIAKVVYGADDHDSWTKALDDPHIFDEDEKLLLNLPENDDDDAKYDDDDA